MTMKYQKRCKDGCIYFKSFGKQKWGYCTLHKKQMSKWTKVCRGYRK